VLRNQILQQKDKFDDIIIDAGGRDSGALRAALILSDVFLVPFQPRSYDVWALADIASIIDEAKSVRDGLRCFALLNFADPGKSADNVEAAEAVANYQQFEYLPVPLAGGKLSPTLPERDSVSTKSSRRTSKLRKNYKLYLVMCFNIKTHDFNIK
jgi:chromosome partitioning protein